MSILPTKNLGSTSSSSSQVLSQNPNPDNGILFSHHHQRQQQKQGQQLSQSPIFIPDQTQTLQSLRISDPQPFSSMPDDVSGPIASASEYSNESSKKVNESGKQNGKKSLTRQNAGTSSQLEADARARCSAQHSGKSSEASVSSRSQRTFGSTNYQGTTIHSAGRKSQMVNGNHLLNFHYDPISRPQPRVHPAPRRHQKRKPYNKDLFLQANYKFVILDSGNYAPELMDPDKMLQWDDIIYVKYSTPSSVQCPICLEDPLCPQITSCGHIFCFPCILQYFTMGEEDYRREFWKKCPLCFLMISSKDLYTIYIENVKQYCIGDTIEFMLLTRQKDSFALSLKHKHGDDNNEVHDSFSKFTLASDVDLSVRKAISELDSWLARADSGLVDDLEKLPYVCAAMEQLEQRKKYWNEHRVCCRNKACKDTDHLRTSNACPLIANATNANHGVTEVVCKTLPTNVSDESEWLGNPKVGIIDGESSLDENAVESYEDQGRTSSFSHDDSKSMQTHTDRKDKDSYNFYQAVDGQHLILHPLNMKCLLHHYGSYDRLPHRIQGKILQLETATQSEATRRRYRYLSHFSLTTTFQLCEVDLCEILPPDAFSPFMDEIKSREKQRVRLARKEQKEKIKADAVGTDYRPIPYNFAQSSHGDLPTFTIDDFEALGSSTVTSSSPPAIGERELFSNVARLGFAAAHDSPSLKNEADSLSRMDTSRDSSGVADRSDAGGPSFANVISRGKHAEGIDVSKVNEMGKKGKKPSRILLSTTGGRRY